jgi:hypothetical protein
MSGRSQAARNAPQLDPDDAASCSKPKETPEEAARQMDRLRQEIGPIGISVSDMIEEGRRR